MSREASISNKTYRVIALLQALPRAPRQSTSTDLLRRLEAEGHSIDKRTIERYLKEISESDEFGSLICCNDSARPYGWSFSKDAQVSLPGMDASMAITWDLVERYLTSLLPRAAVAKLAPVFASAQNWLKHYRPAGNRGWAQKVAYVPRGQQLLPAHVSPAVLDQVYAALYQGQQLDIWYKDKSEAMRFHPQGLVDRGVVRYLVAPARDYDTPVLVALHRIKKVAIVDEPARKLSGFDLYDYINAGNLGYPIGGVIQLKLHFYGSSGQHLYETPLTADQHLEQQPDGSVVLQAELDETSELYWWIQGFGANVEVLAPKSLRKRVAADLKLALSRYAEQ